MNLGVAVENLVEYGISKLGYRQEDRCYARNLVLNALGVYDYLVEKADVEFVESCQVPDAIFAPIVEYAIENGIIEMEDQWVFATMLISFVTPLPSAVQSEFARIERESGAKSATQYLYDLSVANFYIQKTMTDKNLYWKTEEREGKYLEITINLSKPEKNNAEIAKLLSQPTPKNKYPLCPLCEENMGYCGGVAKNPRQTLRTVPVLLDGEKWQLQFSPYVYYNHHAIAFAQEHSNMKIDASTFRKLTDFVERFPHYFMGSNACLPIVGGSILNHEHFQGGGYLFPMHFAKGKKEYRLDGYSCRVEMVDWLNSVLRVSGKSKQEVCAVAYKITQAWENYSDAEVEILAETTAKHNSIAPVARMANGEFVMDLILRNNRTNEAHKTGIFHAHAKHHGIKSEGIGLIEAMGLFILPARLKSQLAMMSEFLQGKKTDHEGMEILQSKTEELSSKFGTSMAKEQADSAVKECVEETCRDILKNTAVFKENIQGEKAFEKFVNHVGMMEV